MPEQPAQPQPKTRICTECQVGLDDAIPHCPSPTCHWCRPCSERAASPRKD